MKYWQERFLNNDKEVFKDAEEYVKYLHEQYQNAISEIEKNISCHLLQIQKEQGLDITEARKLLTNAERMDLDKFIKLSKGKVNDNIERQLKLESRRVRISRLQAMELELKTSVAKIMNTEEKGLFAHLSNAYEKKYYNELYQLQRITGYKAVDKISSDLIFKTIKSPWAPDSKDFSERIWGRGDKLINILRQDLTRDIMTSKDSKETIKHIVDTMNVSKANATRLVMTETSAINSKATLNSYKDFGSEKYEICATLDLKTSDICQEMDGKKFDTKEYKIGVTAPPFHANCRTTTLPCFDDDIEKELDEAIGRVARNPKTGKNERIPNINYKEWYKKYVVPYNDEKEYNDISKILGKYAPTLDIFKDWKYNDSKKYDDIKKDFNTTKAINKNKDIIDKNRAINLYYDFKDNDIYASDHFIEDFIKREYDKKGNVKLSFNEVINICKNKANYVDTRNNRDVLFYNNIAVIRENGKEVSIMYRKKVNQYWKEISESS